MASAAEIFAVLGRIHVLLRRDLNRITDIEWASTDRAYAREVVRLCGTGTHADLPMLAAKLTTMMELAPVTPAVAARAAQAPAPMGPTTQAALAEVHARTPGAPRYLGSLR